MFFEPEISISMNAKACFDQNPFFGLSDIIEKSNITVKKQLNFFEVFAKTYYRCVSDLKAIGPTLKIAMKMLIGQKKGSYGN